ncbi:MAG: hydroxymethylbilane synthase [Oscillospiraceae bacterium]
MKIRVASRESALAVAQTEMVIDCIKKHHPEVDIELITMKTTGDIILDRTLDQIGGKGLFVKELDAALLENRADITVHSLKDLPMVISSELPIIAISKREDARDVLVLPKGAAEIDFSKPIGSSSLRRALQLKKLFPLCEIKSVRGNVLTRLDKLDRGEYGALVLAYAGLKRLGLHGRISRIFEPSEILPAACQGILAVQGRRDFDVSYLSEFNDESTAIAAKAERAFVRALDGGCSSPVAAYCTKENEKLTLTGIYVDEQNEFSVKTICCGADIGEQSAAELALSMKAESGL